MLNTQPYWLDAEIVAGRIQFMEYWNNLLKVRGVPMNHILIHGWSSGLHPEQVLHECVVNGYAMCVAEPRIKAAFTKWDVDYDLWCAKQEDGQHMPKTIQGQTNGPINTVPC